MTKILYLKKRGCDFFKQDTRINKLSDVGNYRVGSYDYSIKGKDGIDYILEFSGWDKYHYRKINKRTGKPLKKEVKEIVLENALYLNTQWVGNRPTFETMKSWFRGNAKPYLHGFYNSITGKFDIQATTKSIEATYGKFI